MYSKEHEIAAAAVAADVWDPKIDRRDEQLREWSENGKVKDFEKIFKQYYKLANTPDSKDPDDSHAGNYRKTWDVLYETIWKNRKKG